MGLFPEIDQRIIYAGIGITVVGGALGFLAMRYHIASPDKILVRTGLGVKDMEFRRTVIQWPFQEVKYLSVAARQVKVPQPGHVKEKIKVAAPITLIYRPDQDLYKEFAVAMSDKTPEVMDAIIIEQATGLMRRQISKMSAEDVYSGREGLQKALIADTKATFAKWGFLVDAAEVVKVWDDDETVPEDRVFANLSRRAIENAHTAARVAKVTADASAAQTESIQGKLIANHNRDLEQSQIEAAQAVEITRVTEEQKVAKKRWELEEEVNLQKQKAFTAEERASVLSKTQAEADKQRMLAEADLFTKQQEAFATLAKLNAEAEGMKQLVDAIGGSQNLIPYLMSKDPNTVIRLAQAQAEAVKGMEPKVTISNWSRDGNEASLAKTMADITQVGSQLAKTLKEHTGMELLPQLLLPPK